MKKLVLFSIILPILSFGQDQRAKSILDKLSEKTSAYSSIEAHFTNNFSSPVADFNESQSGKIYLQGDAFKLELDAQTIISDGETVWIHLIDEEEVTISEEDEDENEISPTKIFTIYEVGYKYQFVKEDSKNYHINLFPEESGAFTKIELYIDKLKMEISSFVMFDKQGSFYSYIINSLTTNKKFDSSFFQFDVSKYPDVEVVDFR
ncbi:outer membrane lipoprotein carrier protein LolA [Flavobacteriales bacterium]|nr:outer membrane lipoprotein carrier protein LolA [Flavobacteriales bacterium]